MSKQRHGMRRRIIWVIVAVYLVFTVSSLAQVLGQNPSAPPSLKTVPVPEPADLTQYVKNKHAAIVLGKALFWDMQVGSDGIQCCGSCHFAAGADPRIKNSLAPGGPDVVGATFDPQHNSAPNYTLRVNDFPFHLLANPDDRHSTVLLDSDDVVAPQGVFKYAYQDIVPGCPVDRGTLLQDYIYNIRGIYVRQCEPRNPPTVINAVFNYRNFWNGRANNIFNGVDPFGAGTGAKLWMATRGGNLTPVSLNMDYASLASQAVGPPVSSFEMSYSGRTFPDIGKKLLSLQPLGRQRVSPTDSVLGPFANWWSTGLNISYESLIRQAFRDEYWQCKKIIAYDAGGNPVVKNARASQKLADNEYTQMQANFSMFFGLAVQLYEATLVSDCTPFDRFQEGDKTALSEQQQQGMSLFQADCADCHGGSLFTNAAVDHLAVSGLIERRRMDDGSYAVADVGFMNTGVRKTEEDLAVGEIDPYYRPLSLSRRALLGDPIKNTLNPPVQPGERVNVDGALKVPGLRNIELTAPYFHNGGQLTLEQVVDFYNRGGDFHEYNSVNMPFGFNNLGLSDDDKAAIVAFMKALTDPRVRYQMAPFDHPELYVPNGQMGNTAKVINDGTGKAVDQYLHIPAVGRAGGPPVQPFLP